MTRDSLIHHDTAALDCPEAEMSLLGSLILDPQAIRDVDGLVGELDFASEANRAIFHAIKVIDARTGSGASLAALLSELSASDLLNDVGGPDYLESVAGSENSGVFARHFAGIVAEKARRRRAVNVLQDTAHALATRPDVTIDAAAERVGSVVAMTEGTPRGGGVKVVRLDTVTPARVSWLYPGWIPSGKVSLIVGDPGRGKSTMTLDWAARVSRGGKWPDGTPCGDPGGVVLLSAEDGLDDTIVPRLLAAGADLSRITALEAVVAPGKDGRPAERSFDLSRDLDRLDEAVDQTPGCKMVIVDPITAYMGSGTNDHKNAEVRSVLAPAAAWAAERGVALVCVTHLNKAGGAPMYRAIGSIAYLAAARVALAVTDDPDDEGRRLVLPLKCNLAQDTGGMAYRIMADHGGSPYLSWDAPGSVTTTAHEVFARQRGEGGGGRTEQEDAADWLRDLLADGPVPASVAEREAKEAGFSTATLRRAKASAGVDSVRQGGVGGDGAWVWTLPPKALAGPPKAHKDAHPPGSEHLREKQAENTGFCPKARISEGVSILAGDEHLSGGPDDLDTDPAMVPDDALDGEGWGEL